MTRRRKFIIRLVIAAGVLLVLLLVWVYVVIKDYPLEFSKEAPQRVALEFGRNRPVSNAYFTHYGFGQGHTFLYRFDSTADSIQGYIADRQLVEMPAGGFASFLRGARTYWWNPERNSTTHFYGNGSYVFLSWNTATGRCHVRRL